MRVSPRLVWGGLLATGGLYEFYALTNDVEGDTLSEVTRDVFGTDTRRGRVAFTVAYVAFSVWFVPHIAAKAVEVAEEVTEPLGTAPRLPGAPDRCLRLLRRALSPTGGPPTA